HLAPDAQGPAHGQRPGDAVGLVGLIDRRHAVHEVGVKRLHVVGRYAGEGRVGHGRIQRVAVLGDALAQGAVEVFERVVTDAGLLVRRDVGRIEGAQRRGDAQAAGVGLAVLDGVAGDAVAGAGQVFAALDELRVGRRVGGPRGVGR